MVLSVAISIIFFCSSPAKSATSKSEKLLTVAPDDMLGFIATSMHDHKDIEKNLLAKGAKPGIISESIRGDTNAMEALLKDSPDSKRVAYGAEQGKQHIAVVVDPNIYNLIKRDLRIYVQDLQNIGYSVITINTKWKNSFALRSALQREYQEGLVGCVLVGNIPIPYFHRDKKSEPRPCVLALMDLNGVWKRNPTNSHYITPPSQPDIFPEIWVGVIAPNSSRESEAKQLKRYFKKLHAFRTARHSLPQTQKALSFVEYDWRRFPKMGLDVLYGDDVVVVSKPSDSSPIRLLTELRKDYEFITIQAHNNGGFTGLDIRDENGKRGDLGIRELKRTRPQTPFYNMFSCSVCCSTKEDYLGGSLIFETPGGVLVLGTTMPGGMNSPDVLYKAWLTSGSFGEAFKKWFIHEIPRDAKATNRRWYLGAIVLGDPTLDFTNGPGKLIP